MEIPPSPLPREDKPVEQSRIEDREFREAQPRAEPFNLPRAREQARLLT